MKNVVNEITEYFKSLDKDLIFSNELHLQMHLAQHLISQGCKLLYEYHVPSSCFDANYPWRTKEDKDKTTKPQEMYLDLVVTDKYEREYVPIEIKYKTRSLGTEDMVVFKEQVKGELLRNQGAQDIGMYNFWKDVCRLELVKKSYSKHVKNGIAIFVTNDPYYWAKVEDYVSRYDFRMTEGRKTSEGILSWRGMVSPNVQKGHPDFMLKGSYEIKWHDIRKVHDPIEPCDFRYCMVVV